MDEARMRQIVREELQGLLATDRYTFQKHIQLFDGRHIQVGKATGTKIGTATTQKLSVYGVTPVVQASAISAPSGGGTGVTDAIDISARSAINSIRTAIKNFGITA